MWVFIFQKYGKFWSISLEHFIKHKPLIPEEWAWVFPGVLTISSFPYIALIYFGKSNSIKEIKKNINVFFYPRPQLERLSFAFRNCDVLVECPLFLNKLTIKRNWKILPYSNNKKIKKDFRFFKNSSVIGYHARHVFFDYRRDYKVPQATKLSDTG